MPRAALRMSWPTLPASSNFAGRTAVRPTRRPRASRCVPWAAMPPAGPCCCWTGCRWPTRSLATFRSTRWRRIGCRACASRAAAGRARSAQARWRARSNWRAQRGAICRRFRARSFTAAIRPSKRPGVSRPMSAVASLACRARSSAATAFLQRRSPSAPPPAHGRAIATGPGACVRWCRWIPKPKCRPVVCCSATIVHCALRVRTAVHKARTPVSG
ncbi:hypothetical protein D9M73_100220 [compost metagenome]